MFYFIASEKRTFPYRLFAHYFNRQSFADILSRKLICFLIVCQKSSECKTGKSKQEGTEILISYLIILYSYNTLAIIKLILGQVYILFKIKLGFEMPSLTKSLKSEYC